MPRKQIKFQEQARPRNGELAQELAEELRSSKESGQPIIEEQEYPNGKVRAVVIWDRWDRHSMEDRTATILRAYETAEGREVRERIVLASGLTIPEAHAAGMLPFQIIPALRKSDKVSAEQCRQALLDEGASTLFGEEKLQLRFGSEAEAEEARQRLIRRVPGSDEIWVITQEVGRVEDWAER